MEYQLKHRLTGAVIIVLVGVLLIPLILKEPVVPLDSSQSEFALNGSSGKRLSKDFAASVDSNIGSDKSVMQENSIEQAKQALVSTQTTELSSETQRDSDAEKTTSSTLVMTAKTGMEESKKTLPISTESTVEELAKSSGDVQGPDVEFDSPEVVGWTVRVGTFADKANENQVIKNLNKHDYMPKRTQVMTGAGEAVRVWLGPYPSEKEAKSVAMKLKDITGQQGYVPKP